MYFGVRARLARILQNKRVPIASQMKTKGNVEESRDKGVFQAERFRGAGVCGLKFGVRARAQPESFKVHDCLWET